VQLVDRSNPAGGKHANADGLHALAFAPNGQLWLAAGKDLRQVDLPGLAVRGSWNNDLADVVTGRGDLWAVAAGRRWALAGGRDGVLRLLDARSLSLVQSWKLCPVGLAAVALAGDELTALVGTCRGEVIRISLPTGDVLDRQDAHTDRVEAVVYAGPDCVASGSADGRIRIWHLRDGALTPWLAIDQPGPVAGLSADLRGDQLAVVRAGERAVGIWSLARLRARLQEMGLSE
jgi:WD40 repeat protein